MAVAGNNLRWVPGLIVERTEDVDDEGRAKSVQESWVRLHAGDDGEPVSELMKLIKDGKDETEKGKREEAERRAKAEEAKRRMREHEAKSGAGKPGPGGDREQNDGKSNVTLRFGGPTPFDPEVQDSVSYHRLDGGERPPGGTGVAYEFALQTAEGVTLQGTAWLAAGTGIPLEMQFTTTPLPKRVKEMSASVRFGTGADGAWWPAEVSFTAMGKFLLFKKRFRSSMTFSEYWWREPR